VNSDSCPSLHSAYTESLHLALVFFDILLLGNTSLLNVPYSMRRCILESVIHEKPGQAMIAERFKVFSGPELCIESATKNLREIWAKHIAECQEGLILKSGVSKYGDWRSPWVKVRKHVEKIPLLTPVFDENS
jgi:DNA ligase 4